jgi:hypothetical protein
MSYSDSEGASQPRGFIPRNCARRTGGPPGGGDRKRQRPNSNPGQAGSSAEHQQAGFRSDSTDGGSDSTDGGSDSTDGPSPPAPPPRRRPRGPREGGQVVGPPVVESPLSSSSPEHPPAEYGETAPDDGRGPTEKTTDGARLFGKEFSSDVTGDGLSGSDTAEEPPPREEPQEADDLEPGGPEPGTSKTESHNPLLLAPPGTSASAEATPTRAEPLEGFGPFSSGVSAGFSKPGPLAGDQPSLSVYRPFEDGAPPVGIGETTPVALTRGGVPWLEERPPPPRGEEEPADNRRPVEAATAPCLPFP